MIPSVQYPVLKVPACGVAPAAFSASSLVGVRREEVLYRSASALSRTFFEVPFQPSAGRLSLPFRCALASGRGCILRGCGPLDNPLIRFCAGLHILYTIYGLFPSFLVFMLLFHPTYSGCFRLRHTLTQGNSPLEPSPLRLSTFIHFFISGLYRAYISAFPYCLFT